MGKNKGFTLIELMVVMAIISILVVLVILIINPAERLREAADRRAATNVRASGTIISSCVTLKQGSLASCNTVSAVQTAGVTNGVLPPTEATNFTYVAATPEICTWEQGRTSSTATWWIYRQSTGFVTSQNSQPNANCV